MNVPKQEVCGEGARLAWLNAQALLDDAQLLADNGRYGRAISLVVLAGEETAKAMMLQWLSGVPDPEVPLKLLRLRWDQIFFDHRAKQGVLGFSLTIEPVMDLVANHLAAAMQSAVESGISDTEAILRLTQSATQDLLSNPQVEEEIADRMNRASTEARWPRPAEDIKKQGLYVGFTAPSTWSSPSDVTREEYEDIRNRVTEHLRRAQIWVGRSDLGIDGSIQNVFRLFASIGGLLWLAHDPKKGFDFTNQFTAVQDK